MRVAITMYLFDQLVIESMSRSKAVFPFFCTTRTVLSTRTDFKQMQVNEILKQMKERSAETLIKCKYI